MPASRHVTLFHSPQSRSAGALILLEELGADYALHVLNLKKGEQRRADYLADLYPEAGITPAIGDPSRGPYLRWLFYYGSSFEPALIDKSLKREPAPASTSPYGDYETMLKTLTDQVATGPFLLGERFTAADVLWGTALRWTTMFKLVPETPVVTDYIARVTSRPAVARAAKIDADLIAAQNAA